MDIIKCPYCGCNQNVQVITAEQESPKQYFIECPVCHTRTSQHDTQMEALAAWFMKIVV